MVHGLGVSGQKTALLLIDIQDFYFPGGRMQLENPEKAGMNAGLILDRFREEGLPVYHVRHNFEPGGNITGNRIRYIRDIQITISSPEPFTPPGSCLPGSLSPLFWHVPAI